MMPPGPLGGGNGLGPGGVRDEAIVMASREREGRSPQNWGVQEVEGGGGGGIREVERVGRVAELVRFSTQR